jgi:hypothetical protein
MWRERSFMIQALDGEREEGIHEGYNSTPNRATSTRPPRHGDSGLFVSHCW